MSATGDVNKCPICETAISHSLLMCSRHWRMVPSQLQARVYSLFRTAKGSEEHRSACLEAVRLVNGQVRRAIEDVRKTEGG